MYGTMSSEDKMVFFFENFKYAPFLPHHPLSSGQTGAVRHRPHQPRLGKVVAISEAPSPLALVVSAKTPFFYSLVISCTDLIIRKETKEPNLK